MLDVKFIVRLCLTYKLSTDLAQIPSLDGEGAEGGWGDTKSMSIKSLCLELLLHASQPFIPFAYAN